MQNWLKDYEFYWSNGHFCPSLIRKKVDALKESHFESWTTTIITGKTDVHIDHKS